MNRQVGRLVWKALSGALLLSLSSLTLTGSVGKEVTSDMVYVPTGTFIMGSSEGREDEGPPRVVFLPGFYMDRYEVTVGEYARFLNALGALWGCEGHLCADVKDENPQSAVVVVKGRYQAEPGREHHPMTWVSWYGARAYCRFYGKRLPTEAEWEKAARGPDGRSYPWGASFSPERANADGTVGATTPVGSYPAGRSPYGLYDMAGNVWEWVADWYYPYPASPVVSSFFGKYKVVRGGSWNHPAVDARAFSRDFAHPERRIGVVGFRCAR